MSKECSPPGDGLKKAQMMIQNISEVVTMLTEDPKYPTPNTMAMSFETAKQLNMEEVAKIYQLPSALTGSGIMSPNEAKEMMGLPPEPATQLPNSCWHCGRDKHEAPLTKRVAYMYDNHSFDASYDEGDDPGPVICVGSDSYGPAMLREPSPPSGSYLYTEYFGNFKSWPKPFTMYDPKWLDVL